MGPTERSEEALIEQAVRPEVSTGDKLICIRQLELQRAGVAEELMELSKRHELLSGQLYALYCDMWILDKHNQ